MEASGKVIAIRLPENHPIFQVERGKRSEVARSWLDVGARLEQLDEKIGRLDEQISRVMELLEANPLDKSPSTQEQKNSFDKEAFLKYFE